MSSFLLEQIRSNQEDIEVYENLGVEQLRKRIRTHKENLEQMTRIASLRDMIVKRGIELKDYYEDKDDDLKKEIESMRGGSCIQNFYSRIVDLKDFHLKYAEAGTGESSTAARHYYYNGDNLNVMKDLEANTFTSEEVLGRHLDLLDFYNRYINMPKIFGDQIQRIHNEQENKKNDSSNKKGKVTTTAKQPESYNITYLQYLDIFTKFADIEPERKVGSNAYLLYLKDLFEYLISFVRRALPLIDLDDLLFENYELLQSFSILYHQHEIPGWTSSTAASTSTSTSPSFKPTTKSNNNSDQEFRPLELNDFPNAKALESVGIDRLKEELQALGMKCGGSLKDRAVRLFSIKGKKKDEIDPKLLVKGSNSKKGDNSTNSSNSYIKKKEEVPLKLKIDPKKRKIYEISQGLNLSTNIDEQEEEEEEEEEEGKERKEENDEKANINRNIKINQVDEQFFMAKVEFFIEYVKTEFLVDVIEATKNYIVKKQTRSVYEIEREIREEEETLLEKDEKENTANREAGNEEGEENNSMKYGVTVEDIDEEEEDSDEDNEDYNPKNVPLGADGKRIPLWQFKLQQLDKEFVCEICDGKVYRGPKKFHEHFNDWIHKTGLQTLGIKYTPSFFLISTVAEAKRVHEANKEKVDSNLFNPNNEEEFEDSEGNVYNKSTYEDLKRQGIV